MVFWNKKEMEKSIFQKIKSIFKYRQNIKKLSLFLKYRQNINKVFLNTAKI